MELDAVGSSRLGPWMCGPRTWGLRRRGGGWALAGTLPLAHGALGLAHDRMRGAEGPGYGYGRD